MNMLLQSLCAASRTILLGGLLSGGACLTLSHGASAAEPYRIPRIDAEITVDAKLDEPFWKNALKIDANIEVRPAENVPAPVETTALLAYTETNLYVAIIAKDPNPSEIRAHLNERDNLGSDDWVLVLFDTFNDQRRSYDFFCNPYGIQSDEIEVSNGNGGDWDAIWYSDGRITEDGYVVEMKIPFSSFSFQQTAGDQLWSFDVVRSYPRSVKHHIGAFPRDRSNNCYLCQAPKLIGFAGVVPGKNVEINPTFSAGYSEGRDGLDDGGYGAMHKRDSTADPGVTATWGVTKNMVLSATLNPDFSQVEADAAQMNINRQFPLYYSEKRPFFTEGSDFYRVGDFVHTRTLADPDWGVKLTGKSGKNTVGFFTVRDTVTPLMFPGPEGADNTTLSLQSQGTMFRYRRDLFSSSNIGVLVTDREGTDYYNRVAIADGEFKFTKKDTFSFMATGSTTNYPMETAEEYDQKAGGFEGAGYKVNYSHDTEQYNVYGEYAEVSPNFRTDLGFITQVGQRYNEVGGQYRWRNGGGHWYTFLSIYGSHDERLDWDGNPLHRVYSVRFNYEGPLQSYIGVYSEYGHNWYESDKYRANIVNAWGGLKPTGSTDLYIETNAGDQIDYTNDRLGDKLRLYGSITQKVGDCLTLGLNHTNETLDVDPGRLYTANITNSTIKYQFNRRAFLRVILQYVNYDREIGHYNADNRDDVDPLTRGVFSQMLFSYEINPRTVFYLGYSDNYQNRNPSQDAEYRDDCLIQTNRAVFTKIGYAWQL
jgi:hypothetical protein